MDIVRLTKLMTAIYDENVGTRNAAATSVHAWMVENRVHPSDLVIDVRGERHARTDRVLKRLEEENIQLRRENAFLREHADPKRKAQAAKARLIENRWAELAAAACTRLRVETLGRAHLNLIRLMIGCSRDTLAKWRKGTARIPDSAFDAVRDADIPAKPPRKQRKPRKPHANGKLPPDQGAILL